MPDRNAGGKRGPQAAGGRRRAGRRAAASRSRRGGSGSSGSTAASSRSTIPSASTRWSSTTQEGIELRREGDPEGARDALRYALQGCGDNMWVHVALGLIALEDFNDPGLARGHFGYAFELAERAIPPDFSGVLPREHTANRPLYDAIDGLIRCHEALGQPALVEELRAARPAMDRVGAAGVL